MPPTKILLLLLLTAANCNGAKILFYFGFSGYSHRIGTWPLIKALADKGHQVTFLSPYHDKHPTPHPNITEVVPKNLAEDIGIINLDFVSLRLNGGVGAIYELWEYYMQCGLRSCKSIMSNPEMVKWINDSSFDLVVINSMWNDCGYAVVHKTKAPFIVISTVIYFMWLMDQVGYPDENLPGLNTPHTLNMTFSESVVNTLNTLYWHHRRVSHSWPLIESYIKEGLNLENFPSIHEFDSNMSLVLVNSHPSESYTRSLPPIIKEVGGMHLNLEKMDPLPKEMETFINGCGPDGFIYLNFGTYASLSTFPTHMQKVFFNAAASFENLRFIFHYKSKPPQDLPSNVLTVPWIPQNTLLVHKKLRLFITHGGLYSGMEAIYYGVPVIVIPLFAEQDYNAIRTNYRETGVVLELQGLKENDIINAITTVLSNNKYKENTQKLSKIFKDRPMKPLDEAVWWVEYVLRNKDNLSHLRPIGSQKTWYERRMLHVWGFIFSCIIFAIIAFILILYCVLTLLLHSHSKKELHIKKSQ